MNQFAVGYQAINGTELELRAEWVSGSQRKLQVRRVRSALSSINQLDKRTDRDACPPIKSSA